MPTRTTKRFAFFMTPHVEARQPLVEYARSERPNEKSRHLAFVATIVATAPALTAQSTAPRTATASKSDLSAERVARIDRALQRYVDENRIAGIVALVLRDGQPVYERAVGWSDKEAGRQMTTDTIFRIASQTKAITSVAILSLVEEGKLTHQRPGQPRHSTVREDDGRVTTEGRHRAGEARRSPSATC